MRERIAAAIALLVLVGASSTEHLTIQIIKDSEITDAPRARLRSLRSDMSSSFFIRILPTSHRVILSVPPLELPPNAEVAMEIRTADGRTLARREFRQSEFRPHKSVMISDKARPLAAGKYSIRLAERTTKKSTAAPRDAAEYSFELGEESR